MVGIPCLWRQCLLFEAWSAQGRPYQQDALAGQGGWTADSLLMEAFPTAGEEIVKTTKRSRTGLDGLLGLSQVL